MAKSNRCWFWSSNGKYTIYVQVDDVTDDLDQVVFKWHLDQKATASLRSTGDILTDCHLLSVDQQGCSVEIAGHVINFKWQEPTQERPGLIYEGYDRKILATTWAERRWATSPEAP
jgi:hypothetical protein